MSIVLLCPRCGVATTYHLPPVTSCSHCQEMYPDGIRVPADTALRRSRAPKPTLLTIGQVCTTVMGAIFLFLFLLAPFNAGSYTIQGVPVSGLDFLRRAGVLWAVLTASLLSIAYGLWRERPWVRPLMIAWWANSVLLALFPPFGDTGSSDAFSGVVQGLIGSLVAWWYLYHKHNVVAYFEARRAPVD